MPNDADNVQKIQKASHRLQQVLRVCLVLVPSVSLVVWLTINNAPQAMQAAVLPHYVQLPLPLWGRLLGFLTSMLHVGVAMYGIIVLMRLFRHYEEGRIFRLENVRCFRSLSRALLLWFAASVVSVPIRSLALTLHHPPGQHYIELSLGSPDLTALLVGLVVGVIAWVMDEGRKLQEQQDYMI